MNNVSILKKAPQIIQVIVVIHRIARCKLYMSAIIPATRGANAEPEFSKTLRSPLAVLLTSGSVTSNIMAPTLAEAIGIIRAVRDDIIIKVSTSSKGTLRVKYMRMALVKTTIVPNIARPLLVLLNSESPIMPPKM